MNILFLKHEQINKLAWDQCIFHSSESQIYAMSWYLDCVSPGWQALVIKNEKGYETVLSLPVHYKLGIAYLQQPLFCQQLGLFSLLDPMPQDYLKLFLKEIKKRFKYSIDYTFNSKNASSLFLSSYTTTRYLNLAKDYQEIVGGYTKDRKLNLRRGKKSGLVVSELDDSEIIIDLFKRHTAHKVYGGVSEQAYLILINLVDSLRKYNSVRLLGSLTKSGEVLTAALFTVWKNRIIYLFCSSSPEGRKLNGNTLVLDSLIREYSGKDYVLDFESPESSSNQVFDGIDGFSRSFGAEKVILPQLTYNNLPIYIKFIKQVRMKLYKTIGF